MKNKINYTKIGTECALCRNIASIEADFPKNIKKKEILCESDLEKLKKKRDNSFSFPITIVSIDSIGEEKNYKCNEENCNKKGKYIVVYYIRERERIPLCEGHKRFLEKNKDIIFQEVQNIRTNTIIDFNNVEGLKGLKSKTIAKPPINPIKRWGGASTTKEALRRYKNKLAFEDLVNQLKENCK